MTTEEKIRIIEESNSFAELPSDALPPSYKENYYFVSYSHKDYKRVLKDILLLEELGVNIWYDKEMHIGENWQEIAQLYISKFQCSGVIFYLTENSISSPACNKEVEYVLTHDKNFLSVNVPLEGRSVESGYSMLRELKRRGLQCSDELLSNFKKAFPDEILYLSVDDKIENKAREILSIEREPLYDIRKTVPLFEHKECLGVFSCRDNTIISADLSRITEADGFSGRIGEIGDCVFTNSIKLQTVKLPKGLVAIGESAFRNCVSLTDIDLSAQTGLRIGKNAFKGCSQLTDIDLRDVYEIGEGAFSDCEKLSVTEINGRLGSYAFQNSGIEYVDYIAESPEISNSALYGARSLREFNVKNRFSADIGNSAFSRCERLERVGPFIASNTPTLMNEKKTLRIGAYAFNGCDALREVSFAGGFDAGEATGAFWACKNLERLELNIVGTQIGDLFARDCKKLRTVSSTTSFTHIGEEAFEGCESLSDFDLSGVARLEKAAFADAGLEKAFLRDVEYVGKSALANNKPLRTLHVGESCKRIESYAFLGCRELYSVKILAKDVDLTKSESVFAYTDIKVFYLRSMAVLDLIREEGVLDNLHTLYIGSDLDVSAVALEGFSSAKSDANGFLKFTRGNGCEALPIETADISDPELNVPDPYGKRFKGDINLFVGREAEIKHSRLASTYTAFVEGVKYVDGTDEVDFITLSDHTGKSFNLDGTLIRTIAHTTPKAAARIRLDDPAELNGKSVMAVAGGEYRYVEVAGTEVEMLIGYPKRDSDGKYPLLAIYYDEGGRRMALSGADIESLTVYSESFESIKTLTRE